MEKNMHSNYPKHVFKNTDHEIKYTGSNKIQKLIPKTTQRYLFSFFHVVPSYPLA